MAGISSTSAGTGADAEADAVEGGSVGAAEIAGAADSEDATASTGAVGTTGGGAVAVEQATKTARGTNKTARVRMRRRLSGSGTKREGHRNE